MTQPRKIKQEVHRRHWKRFFWGTARSKLLICVCVCVCVYELYVWPSIVVSVIFLFLEIIEQPVAKLEFQLSKDSHTFEMFDGILSRNGHHNDHHHHHHHSSPLTFTCLHSSILIWVVVSNVFNFHPENWGNDPIWLHNIFQRGWHHQLVMIILYYYYYSLSLFITICTSERQECSPWEILQHARCIVVSWRSHTDTKVYIRIVIVIVKNPCISCMFARINGWLLHC